MSRLGVKSIAYLFDSTTEYTKIETKEEVQNRSIKKIILWECIITSLPYGFMDLELAQCIEEVICRFLFSRRFLAQSTCISQI